MLPSAILVPPQPGRFGRGLVRYPNPLHPSDREKTGPGAARSSSVWGKREVCFFIFSKQEPIEPFQDISRHFKA